MMNGFPLRVTLETYDTLHKCYGGMPPCAASMSG